MEIGATVAVVSPVSVGAITARDPRALVHAFDATVLRMLAGSEGLFGVDASEDSQQPGFAGEVLSGLVADELARSLNLGLGRAMIETGNLGEGS